jgi:hypothetical protein
MEISRKKLREQFQREFMEKQQYLPLAIRRTHANAIVNRHSSFVNMQGV